MELKRSGSIIEFCEVNEMRDKRARAAYATACMPLRLLPIDSTLTRHTANSI